MNRDEGHAARQTQAAEPLYKQIERDILQCLARGEWKPGAQLPTEAELAARFGVAIFTVRAGIGELVDSGILTRQQGKGTFVVRHERDRSRQNYSRVYYSNGRRIIPTHERVIRFAKQRGTRALVESLDLDEHKAPFVYAWDTLVHVGENCVSLRHLVVPAHLFPGLSAKVFDDNEQNIYSLYQDGWGVTVLRLEERISSALAGRRVAELLGIKPGAPLLQVDRVAFTYNNVPVELRSRVYDSSRFHYRSELNGI